MTPKERRESYRLTTPLYDQLLRLIDMRISAENEFKQMIIAEIKAIITNLAECDHTDPTNTASTLALTTDQLSNIIQKLNDNTNISSEEAKKIGEIVKNSNLRKGPAPAPESLPTPSASMLAAPAPAAPPVPPAPPVPAALPVPAAPPVPPVPPVPTAPVPAAINKPLPPSRRPQPPVKGGRRTRKRRR